MKEITAQLNNYRQSPRKVRLVANAIKGKKVSQAKNILNFLTKRATGPIHKLLNSALANAKNMDANVDSLFVKTVSVDQGDILYRRMPVAHGAAHPIRKRTSKIKLILAEGKAGKQEKLKK